MAQAHRHDDIEINLVVSGSLSYLFGGTPVTVASGNLAVFWAATPHRLVPTPRAEDSDVCWIHVPLQTVVGWDLGERSIAELLQSHPVVVPASVLGRVPEGNFERWLGDLDDPHSTTFALLEIQALVRRVVDRSSSSHRVGGGTAQTSSTERTSAPILAMAQYAVTHFREPVQPADVAHAAHLHPNYAATIFKQAIGTTIGDYLARCRVAEAQRLLITTTMTTNEIAHTAGFGSLSSFYAVFGRACSQPPGEYRRQFSDSRRP
jgi:AraC-like DNA-binding protein